MFRLAATMLVLVTALPTASANLGNAIGPTPPAVIDDDNLNRTVRLRVEEFLQPPGQEIVDYDLGDVTITCIFSPDSQPTLACYVCVGPGETQDFPVEVQGAGIAVGIPGEPGFYAEQDARGGRASCA